MQEKTLGAVVYVPFCNDTNKTFRSHAVSQCRYTDISWPMQLRETQNSSVKCHRTERYCHKCPVKKLKIQELTGTWPSCTFRTHQLWGRPIPQHICSWADCDSPKPHSCRWPSLMCDKTWKWDEYARRRAKETLWHHYVQRSMQKNIWDWEELWSTGSSSRTPKIGNGGRKALKETFRISRSWGYKNKLSCHRGKHIQRDY